MKLNLGCGKNLKDGYINIDVVPQLPSVVKSDIKKLSYGDNTIDEIYLSMVLEHIDNSDVRTALKEWNRVLKKGGKIVIIVPNIIGAVKAYLENRLVTHAFPNPPFEDKALEVLFQMVYGRADIFGGNEYMQHRTGFSYKRLERFLNDCGFEIVKANDNTDTEQDLEIEATKQ